MAAKPCDQWHHMCEPYICHGLAIIPGKFCLNLFSHFREEDFLFKKKINMAVESRDHWRHQFFFLWTILSLDDPQKFSCWSDEVFYICNNDVITKAPMTSKKSHLFPMRKTCHVPSFNFFSLVQFQRYRGPKFFRFSDMAATPRDLWRHNYH